MENTEINDLRLSPHLASPSEAVLSHSSQLDGLRLSPHFVLGEFLNLAKHPDNVPTMQQVVSMAYGCLMLLEPARTVTGCPIIVNSGFRNAAYNARVGGASRSQHLVGQAADIRPGDPSQFQLLVDYLRLSEHTDQLLTGRGWLHISWNPFGSPRHDVRLGYYK